jgi:lactate dehydrogenase-like 2-hydroxyacid dehydrogenase
MFFSILAKSLISKIKALLINYIIFKTSFTTYFAFLSVFRFFWSFLVKTWLFLLKKSKKLTKITRKSIMEIVILDSLTFGSDIDLSIFNQFGKTTVYKTTGSTEITDRIKKAEIIIPNKVEINAEVIKNAAKLKLVCVAATGYNNIDIASAKEHGVVVANVQNYSSESVAQHTFSLILALQNSLINNVQDTRNGRWSRSKVFTVLDYPFYELTGKKIGIIGYGSIGKQVAKIAKAFDMEVLIYKRYGKEYPESNRVDFEILLAESDIISIHAPLSESTLNLFSTKEFKKMKSSAIIINTARGGIINEEALYHALKNHTIRAAAIDVVQNEPIEANSKLHELNNLLITPHIAWASFKSRQRLIDGIVINIKKFLAGESESINLAK